MKKKIKADSVDELFEIVKAIQNGEEPEAYEKRKEKEAQEAKKAARKEAAAQKHSRVKTASSHSKSRRDLAETQKEIKDRSERAPLAEKEDDEIFERLLDDEPDEDLQESAEKLVNRMKRAGGVLRANLRVGAQEGRKRLNHLKTDIFEEEEEESKPEETDTEGQPSGTASDVEERKVPSSPKPIPVHRIETPSRNDPEEMAHAAGAAPARTGAALEDHFAIDGAPVEDRVGDERDDSRLDDAVKTDEEPQQRAGEMREIRPEGEDVQARESHKEMEMAHAVENRPVMSGTPVENSLTADKHQAEAGADGESPTEAVESKSGTLEEKEAGADLQSKDERPVVHGRLSETESVPAGKTQRRYGAKAISEEAEKVGQRILRSLHMETETADVDDSTDIDIESIDLDTVQILDRLLDSAGSGHMTTSEDEAVSSNQETARPEMEMADSQTAHTTASDQPDDQPGTVDASEVPLESAHTVGETPVKNSEETSDKFARTERLSDFKETPHTPNVRAWLRRRVQKLEEKGFGRKQRFIAGVGAVAALLVIVLIACTVGGMIRRQAKQKYVTADSGLTILVENQPDSWCNSCELELKITVKSGTISSVEIGDTVYEIDDKGRVTVTAEESLVNVAVVTEESTLTAQIEIPMLDAAAPVLSVDKSKGEITVTAADARSGLAGIWYAVVDEDDWLQLPLYQQYSEPIPYEESKIYYFYAEDQAGNISTPLVTNMVEAESVTLGETELTLLEGETAYLQLTVTPANAYLTNVTYESSNTDVVTVTSSGLVTAAAEGGALIRVSADDIETVTCSVTVVAEQTVTVSAIGDCTLGTYAGMTYTTDFNTYYSMYGASYFFENVRDILENDDITFANLEGPLTDETTAVEKEFAFKGSPSYTSILLDGSIEVVTLANNHSSDYGTQGLTDTEENLTGAGIDYCIGNTIAYQDVSGVKVAFIGIYELVSGMDCESQVRETIAEAQREGAQLIIVAFHWGTEKETAADETQQALAHIAVDCGADLVVGHHPHVLQGIEKYNGKYIVYSLGNFCFGGNTNPSDKDTMIFRQTFTITSDGVVEDDAIEIIPCTISSTSSYNDYRPTPATGADADAIMERINEYSAQFGDITYVASDGV